MMKKLLSVLLAGILLLSMTAFGTDWNEDWKLPQSKVYFTEDFSEYEKVGDFSSNITPLTATATVPSGPDVVAQFKEPENRGKIYNINSNFDASKAAFETNSVGKKSLRTLTSGNTSTSSKSGSILYLPSEGWNFLENKNDIFIISYDLDVNPATITADDSNYNESFTYWGDTELKNGTSIMISYSTVPKNKNDRVNYKYVWGKQFQNNINDKPLKVGTTYRMAMGFTYDEDAVKDHDGTGEYIVPSRYYSPNGEKIDNDLGGSKQGPYYSLEPYGTTSQWKDKPVLTGFALGWARAAGYEYADIKAYTINKDPDSFGVTIVDDTVELGDAAVVKFTHPVYHGSVTKDALTITDEYGNDFNNFEIGKINDVIKNLTNEVYTTAEILFPYGIKSGTKYKITFNNADESSKVVNEIAFKLGEHNSVEFTTEDKPYNRTSINKLENLTAGQATFTAKVTEVESEKPSFLFIGVYDENGKLVSYSYTSAKHKDELSLSSKLAENYSVKAFCSGSVYDLSEFFGTPAEPQTVEGD